MHYDDGIGGVINDDDPSDPRNRAEYAFTGLLAYVKDKGHEEEDTLTEIQSLIGDLLHLADQHCMNYAPDFVAGAVRHYEAEKAEYESEA